MNRGRQILKSERLARLAAKVTGAYLGHLECELGQMQFQCSQVTGVQRGLQQVFALGEIDQNGAGLVLTASGTDRGADDANERGWMEWPLDEGDVAECLAQPRRVRIALRATALMRQQHDRKIRP